MTTPLIEAIARAIAEGQGDDFDHAHRSKPHWIETRGESGGRYRDINEPRQPDFIDAAQAALTAITEAGMVIVPREPTQDMISAGIIERHEQPTPEAWSLATSHIYRAMIEAGRVKT